MIDKLRLQNFRNFKDISFNLANSLIIFLGNNAVGKTSVLEAINFISTTKSHRTANYQNLINYESDNATISLLANNILYKAIISKKGKYYFINNKAIKPIDFACQIKTIFFSPYDLNLVNGTKEERRKFLDLNISLINTKYLKNLILYKKILKKRNELLKETKINQVLLKVITKNLVDLTSYINSVRKNYLFKINSNLANITSKLNFFKLELISDIKTEKIADLYNRNLEKDLLYKTTTFGPHRDSFIINLDNKEIKFFGSQGQIRLAVICLKLAIYEIVKEENNPILLLDDVFAELDYTKQISLVKYLDNYQTFITTTSLSEIPSELLKKAMIIKL